MKIAFMHFYTFRLRRGIETLVLSLANALAAKGEDVTILTAQRSLDPLIAPSPDVRVREFPTFRYYEALTIVPFYLADLVRNKYDIVNIFFADFGEGLSINLAAPLCSFQLNMYLCFPFRSAPHRYEAFRRHRLDARATRILADAEYTALDAQNFFGRQVQVVPVGADPLRFCPNPILRDQMRQTWGISQGDVVLLNVSALEERKGTWRVLEILPALLAKVPNIRYFILGDGPFRPTLERMVIDLKLQDHVVFAGTTTHLASFYNLADVFVLLPDEEANSVACHEAMMSGLPVIVGSHVSENVSRELGRIVDVYDSQSILEAISELAKDRDLRHVMGERARDEMKLRLSWDHIATGLLELFTAQLDKP